MRGPQVVVEGSSGVAGSRESVHGVQKKAEIGSQCSPERETAFLVCFYRNTHNLTGPPWRRPRGQRMLA